MPFENVEAVFALSFLLFSTVDVYATSTSIFGIALTSDFRFFNIIQF